LLLVVLTFNGGAVPAFWILHYVQNDRGGLGPQY
jgi:hypothetical protein